MDIVAASEAIGISKEMLTITVCVLSAFPLAALYRLIPARSRSLQHVFSITTTSLLSLWLFGAEGLLHLLVPALAVYWLVRYLPRSRWTPIAVFAGTMVHLCVVQLEAQYGSGPKTVMYLDVSPALMVLVIRLTSFAWAVHDGTRSDKDVHPEMKPFIIKKYPSVLEFFGFVLFFASVWIGPAFEYRHYHDFVRRLHPYNKIPSTIRPAFKRFAIGILLFSVSALIDHHFSVSLFTSPLGLSQFQSFWYRSLYLHLSLIYLRTKLGAAWKIAEAAGILVGIGYDGIDARTGKPKFNRLENIDAWGIESAQSPKELVDAWNIKTANWLRRYVYYRVTPPGVKPNAMSTVITNFTSALWHGFYPGYYLSFLSLALCTIAARSARRAFRPLFVTLGSPLLQYKRFYDIAGLIVTHYTFNYIFMAFPVRRADATFAAWRSVYFAGHLLCIAAIVVLDVLGVGKLIGRSFGLKKTEKPAKSEDRTATVVKATGVSSGNGSMDGSVNGSVNGNGQPKLRVKASAKAM